MECNIVCGVSYKKFSKLTPLDYEPLDREGMHAFEWWRGEYRTLEELIAEMDEAKKQNSCDQ